MKYMHIILLIASVGLFSGCATVGPNYQPPIAPVIESFSTEGSIKSSEGVDMTEWWKKLHDPYLNNLIEYAIANNHDIRIAFSRILEARANKGIAQSVQLPSISVGASASALRLSETGLEIANLPASAVENFDPTQELYEGGFDASWEIDLFGRIKRSIEAADAEIDISEAGLEDAMVTLLSEVARNYVEIRMVQAQIDITKQNLDIQQKTLDLIVKRFEQGLDTRLNITRSEALIADTEARIPRLQTQQKTLRHRLATLLGEAPNFLNPILDNKPEIPIFPEDIVVGIPADLLRNRPDIHTAERNFAAQVARIGIAEADFYPRLQFNGLIGLSTVDLQGSSLDNSWTGSLGPSFTWALFEGGAIRARVDAADARAKAALALYEKAVIRAYEEVENALVEHAEELRRREHLKQAVSANMDAYELSRRLYSSGLVDYINVLDTQRELLNTRELLIESNAIVTYSIINLYKAFGGGMASLESHLSNCKLRQGRWMETELIETDMEE
jgi:NodT family efflux transporter outer membrane factor (OMF) lipoprotein